MCNWCDRGATDLVFNRDGTGFGQIDKNDGVMTISIFPDKEQSAPALQAYGIMNFCPKCGKPIGRDIKTKFLKELMAIFDLPCIGNVEQYAGSVGWNMAKERIEEFRHLSDEEILERIKI